MKLKRKTIAGLLAAVMGASAIGQTIYENDGLVLAPPAFPPQIDANTFINNGKFIINFTNTFNASVFGLFLIEGFGNLSFTSTNTFILSLPESGPQPYETQNTLNFTNKAGKFMSGNSGFRFDYVNGQSGLRSKAANFNNAGTINSGTVDTTNYLTESLITFIGTTQFISFGVGGSKLIVQATNIVNSGTNNLGFEGLAHFEGDNVNLTRGTIAMEETGFSLFDTNLVFAGNVFDGSWGLSTNVFMPYGGGRDQGCLPPPLFANLCTPPTTPIYSALDRYYIPLIEQMNFTNATQYLSDITDCATSNRWVDAVFLQNTNMNLRANVFAGFGQIDIEYTNLLGTSSNNLYIFDNLGTINNNALTLIQNGFAGPRATYIPSCFFVGTFPSSFFGFFGVPATPTAIPPFTFSLPNNINPNVTNQYASYQALLLPTTRVLGDVFEQNVTNVPGRIEIIGNKTLALTNVHMASLNYMLLKATNHFTSSAGSRISAPYVDVNLRSTNGLLTISNLLAAAVLKNEGTIDLYGARWTNIFVNRTDCGGPATITNHYNVLFVNTTLSPISPSRAQDFILRTTTTGPDAVVIHDLVNVTRSLLIDSSTLTVATNDARAATPTGGIILTDPGIVWSTSMPRLKYLTNFGILNMQNSVFFGGSRTQPYYTSNFNEPYIAFVNSGGITNFGSLIWAQTFVNSGTFLATGGDIQLQQALTTVLAGLPVTNSDGSIGTSGAFLAGGDISISSGSLLVSNHVLEAASAINLSVSGTLNDGSLNGSGGNSALGVTNKNFWSVGNGINLLATPTTSSLLATTITNTDGTYAEIVNTWAGIDHGCSADAFINPFNNAAIGHLILDARDPDSLFTFTGTTGNNAIYVDELEFVNYATNRDVNGDFTTFNINSGMKVYFAQAIAGGQSVAEKLNGHNGGGFCWVSNYNTGFFSSTTNFGGYCATCPGGHSQQFLPDGTVVRLNAALVQSCAIDSDNDGAVNGCDTTPLGPIPYGITSAADLAFKASYTNAPQRAALLSWNTAPYCSNYLYYVAAPNSTNWQMVTNFVTGPVGGRVTVSDPIKTNGVRYYKARVVMP